MRHIPIQPHGQGPRSRRALGRLPHRRRLARRHVPLLECCEQRVVLSTSTWIGGAHVDTVVTSGSPTAWSNPLNWLGGVPGVGDTADFTDNVTFTLPNHNPNDPPVTFNHPFNESPLDGVNASVAINVDSSWSGSIEVAAGVTLTLTGSSEWDGGSLVTDSGGALINSATGTLTLQNPAIVDISGTLTNQGIVNEDGSAPIQMAGGTINNESGATFDIQSNQGLTFDDSLADNFTNSGLLEQTVGTGTTDFNTSLSNAGGTIDIQTGTFEWDGDNGVSTGGTFDASPGAVLQYGIFNQSNTWTGTYTGGGGGQFDQGEPDGYDSEIVIGSAGATFNFDPGFYQWLGGDIAAAGATATVTNVGTITLAGPVSTAEGNAMLLNAGVTLDNQGTIDQSGAGSFVFRSANLINESNGVFDFQSDTGWVGFGSLTGVVTNEGLIEKTGTTGQSVINVLLDNQGGTLDVQSGTLIPWNGLGSVSTGGTFDVAAGATIQYNNGGNTSNTFTGTYTGSGGGQFVLNSDNLVIGTGGATFDFPSGFFQWIGGGELTATAGTLTNTGFITVDTSDGSSAVFSGTLTNSGTITFQNTGSTVGFFDGGTLNNPSGGVINLNGIDDQHASLLDSTVNNSGTINSNSTGTVSIAVLNNTGGTLDAQTGTLIPWNLNGSVSTGGTFEAAAGATIQYNYGGNTSNTFTGTYTGSGGGQFVLNSDNLVIGTGGATFDFPSGLFQWIGGGELTATAGTLTNTGFITVDTSDGAQAVFSGTLDNSGTLTIQNNGGSNVRFFDGGTVNNASGGVINLNGIDYFNNPLLDSTVNNSGTINSNSTGTVAIFVLNNTGGTLDAQTGILIPWNGSGSVSTGGTFEAAAGATIQYNNGGNTSNTFTGTYTGSGGGQFVLNSDNLVIGSGGATFDFPSGFFQWIGGGELTATAGTLTNTGFITVDTSDGTDAFFSGSLTNSGTITFQNTGSNVRFFDGGTLNNASGGVISLNGIDYFNNPLVDSTVNNSGTINSNSTGTVAIFILNNTGTVAVQSGTLDANSVTQISSKTLTGGTWDVSGGSTLNLQNGTALTANAATVVLDGAGSALANFVGELAANSGSFTVQDGATFTTPGAFSNTGAVTIGNDGSILTTTGNYTQSGSGSLTNLQGGTLKPLTLTTTINGGLVAGAGTIQGSVTNAAAFQPGSATSGGTISITKNYTQTAGGALDIGLGGAGAGQFGQLAVMGTANLNGSLNVTLINGFVPTDTDLFPAVTYAVQAGTFSTVSGTSLPDKQTLTTSYTSSNLTLGVTADVTSLVSVSLGGLRVNRTTRQVAETVTITNTSSSPIAGAISFVLDGLTAGVTLVGATGITQQVGILGSSYINVVPAGSQLGAGQSVTFTLIFNDPSLISFSYTPRILAGLGQR
jgi:hypothetical protein